MDTLRTKKTTHSALLLLSLCLVVPLLTVADSSSLDNYTTTLRVETDHTGYLQGQTVKIYVYVGNWLNVPVEYPTMIGYSVGVGGSFVCITWAYSARAMTENTLVSRTIQLARIVRSSIIYLLNFVYTEEERKKARVKGTLVHKLAKEIPDNLKK